MLIRGLLRVNRGHGDSQSMINRSHPVRVAPGQVIVDGDQMDAPPGQRIQIKRAGGDQGLTFTGPHLGDFTLMQNDAADQLDIEMALMNSPFGSFPDCGEGFRQESHPVPVFQRLEALLPVSSARSPGLCIRAKFLPAGKH